MCAFTFGLPMRLVFSRDPLTGHYGVNWEDLKTLVRLVQPHVGVRLYALPDFEANIRGFFGTGNHNRDHAGKVETSQLMALEPEQVDLSRLPPPDSNGPNFALGPDIALSSRVVGERMVAEQAIWLGEKARELLGEYESAMPRARLQTFAEVERLWAEVVVPVLPTFKTMQDNIDEREVSEASRWYPNWRITRPR